MNENNNAPSSRVNSEEAVINRQFKNTDFLHLLKTEIQTFSNKNSANENCFPTDGLPLVIAEFAAEVAEVYGVPVEFPALSALCAISSVIRKKFVLNNGNYKNFGQLWVMFVAPPGVGKTEPVSAAFRPLQHLDKISYDNYQKQIVDWKRETLEAKQNKILEPDKPVFKQCLIDDFTPESLYQIMFRNEGAISLYRDELSGWFADFGRYSKNGEVSRYLSIFNNAQFCINRKSEEPIQIPEPFMTICGTIQPEILNATLANNSLKENGFANRFLYVYPQNIKKQKYREKLPDLDILKNYEQLISHCYSLPKSTVEYILSNEAKELFIHFANRTTDLVNNTTDNFLRATYAKMEIQALRISLIIQIVRGVSNQQEWNNAVIHPDAMQYAIQLCEYFNHCVLNIGKPVAEKSLTTSDAIRMINREYGIANKQLFADSIGVSRQYISKLCNESL